MQFDSFTAFIDMGGYGFYVWLSYGIAALAIALLIILSKQKHKQTLQSINQRYIRETKRKTAAQQQHKSSSFTESENNHESAP